MNKILNIGILAADRLFDEYSVKITNSIIKSAEEKDVNIFCFVSRNFNSNINEIESIPYDYNQGKEIFEIINSRKLDGLIVLLGCIYNYTDKESLNNILDKFDVPIISVGAEFYNANNLLIDNYSGMKNLITHFIKDHGYKKIAFIKGGINNPEAEERYRAYKDTLKEFNIKYDDKLVVQGTFIITSTINEIATLIDENKAEFDAVIAASDVIAARALESLKSYGLKVPDDVALGGFDDSNEAGNIFIPLTTVRQPLSLLGQKALNLMLSKIKNEEIKKTEVLNTDLMIRRTCGCFNYPGVSFKEDFNENRNSKKEEIKNLILKESFFFENNIKKHFLINNNNKIIKKWSNKFLDILSNLFSKNNYKKYIVILEKIMMESINLSLDIDKWINIINNLFYLIIKNITDNKLKYYFEKIHKNTILIIDKYLQQTLKSLKIDHRNKYVDYYFISNAFISASNIEDLENIIISRFPRLNINSLYIYLYLDIKTKNKVKSICGYYKYKDKYKAINKNEIYDSQNIIPEKICIGNNQKTFIIIPLFDNNINTGFIVFETNKLDEAIFEILSIQINNAIKSVNLLEEIHNYSWTLEEKVKERTYKLQQAKDENERKLNYFINLSHEIKTPLTLIKNYFDKYLKENNNDDKDLQVIKKNVDILCGDIINILDIEKVMKNQKIHNEDQTMNLSSFILVKTNLFKELAAKKNIIINTKIQNNIYIKIDPYSLDRILNNLIDNAVKYNKKNGKIDVELNIIKKNIEIVIRDTGIGMNKNQIDDIVSKSEKSKDNFYINTGFGLKIVKMIVDDLNEKIIINSEKNKGTEIKIIFTRHKAQNINKITSDVLFNQPKINQENFKLTDSEYNENYSTIFIVEDNHYMLYYLQDVLKEKYNFYFAKNGKQALMKLINIPKPDLIISDIMMDEMDGIEFFEIIKNDGRFKDIPLIFLTAKSTREEKIKGLKKGAVDYIYKPFNIEELQAKIESVLKNRTFLKESNEEDFLNKIKNVIKNSPDESSKKLTLTEKSLKHGISKKELEVLELLVKGKEYKEISLNINVPVNTVKARVHKIYKKFNVNNKIELINLMKK